MHAIPDLDDRVQTTYTLLPRHPEVEESTLKILGTPEMDARKPMQVREAQDPSTIPGTHMR